MRYTLIFLMSLLCNSVIAAELSDDISSGTLTLERACEITLTNNPDFAAAVERINSAGQILKQVQSSRIPAVDLTAGRKYQRVVDQPDWEPDYRMKEYMNQWTVGIGFNWLLFDGFVREANIMIAQQEIKQAEELSFNIKRLLAQASSIAFLQSQLAMENMVVAAQNQHFNLHLEQQAKVRYETGTAPESEVLNFSLRALQAETDYMNAELNFRTACTVLAELMAVKDAELTAELLPERFKSAVKEFEYDFNQEFSYALEHRPDLRKVQAEIIAAKHRVKVQKGNYYPKLSVVGGVDYTKTEDVGVIDQDENIGYLGVNLSWNLFSGGRRESQVAQARHDELMLEQQYKGKILEIQSGIQQAIANLDNSYRILENQLKIQNLAVRIRDSVNKAYLAGTVSVTRLNEVQTDLVAVFVRVNAAKIQCEIDGITLDAETGKITEIMENICEK